VNKDRAASPADLVAGRREHFEALWRANHAAVFGYVLRRAQSPDDAADAIAETFTIAWRRLEAIPAGDRARLWLYGTARRVLSNQRRAERRRSSLAERLRAELVVGYQESEQHTGEFAELLAAFRRLREGDRELLSLEGWEGLDAAQIAEVLGCSRNAARIRLHRARRHLAECLADFTEDVSTGAIKAAKGETA
jgi:RNA polymerase sigma factor (sigma-70 family)